MAKYRPFLCSFWTDPDIEPMTAEEKLVYAFFFTNQLTSESGIYSISLKYISERTNISLNKINNIINTLQNTYHKITYDNNIVFVHGFMNRNYRGNSDLLNKSIIYDFHNNRSLICWSKFIEIYKIHHISIEIKELLKTCGEPHKTSMNMSMKDEDDNDINSSLKDARKLSSYSADFELFWKEYPRRKDKGHAYKQWLTEIKITEPQIIISGATRYAAECSGKDEKYIKFAQGWLSGQRWLDEKGPGRFDHIADPVRREIMEKYAE